MWIQMEIPIADMWSQCSIYNRGFSKQYSIMHSVWYIIGAPQFFHPHSQTRITPYYMLPEPLALFFPSV